MFFSRHPKNRRPRPATLGIESLERRLPLAGDVTVAFTGGTLTITGDAQGNQIWVAQRGDQTVVSPSPWEMNGATRLRFGTSVGLPRVELTGVQAVVIDLRGGNDVLAVGGPQSDAPRFRSLAVNFGAGNNIMAAQGMMVDQNVTIVAGDGTDSVGLNAVTVWGSTAIRTGNGGNVVDLSGSLFNGPLDIASGRNNDRVSVSGVSMSTLVVQTGEGQDLVGVVLSAVVDRLDIATGSGDDYVALKQLGQTGAFGVNTGEGNDQVFVHDWLPGPRSLTVNLGAGHNAAGFGGLVIGGPLTVTGGAGSDAIGIQDVVVQGRLTINAGDGNNTSRVVRTSALAMQIATGQGVDGVVLVSARCAGDFVLRTGAGADEVLMADSDIGRIDLDLGAGNDIVTLDRMLFRRRTKFDGGLGRDTVRFAAGAYSAKFFTSFEVAAPIGT